MQPNLVRQRPTSRPSGDDEGQTFGRGEGRPGACGRAVQPRVDRDNRPSAVAGSADRQRSVGLKAGFGCPWPRTAKWSRSALSRRSEETRL